MIHAPPLPEPMTKISSAEFQGLSGTEQVSRREGCGEEEGIAEGVSMTRRGAWMRNRPPSTARWSRSTPIVPAAFDAAPHFFAARHAEQADRGRGREAGEGRSGQGSPYGPLIRRPRLAGPHRRCSGPADGAGSRLRSTRSNRSRRRSAKTSRLSSSRSC